MQRFARDVLNRSNARAVFILLGTNDLSFPKTAGEIYDGLVTMARQAQAQGLCVMVSTILPRNDPPLPFGWDAATEEPERQRLNQMILASTEFDAVADLASSFNALPLAPLTATSVAAAGTSAAAPADARVPVPTDDPGFGAALGTQVSVMVRDGVQTARLQLNPAEMGPIAVQIALDGSSARVDFQADLAGTRAVIEASLPALDGALQDAGFTLAGGGVFQQTPGRQGQGDQPANPGLARQADGTMAAGSALPAAPGPQRTQRGLVDLVA